MSMLKGLLRERRRSVVAQRLAGQGADPGDAGEPAFTRFAEAAALAFNAPIAAVSLIHQDVQSVLASRGFPIGGMPRHDGFCTYALDRPGILECCDPAADVRFAGLPGVTGEPHVRYYAGAPLRLLDGSDIGTLCVADVVERAPASPDQIAYLIALARQASMALDNRLDLRSGAA